jgi:hypothetical protein
VLERGGWLLDPPLWVGPRQVERWRVCGGAGWQAGPAGWRGRGRAGRGQEAQGHGTRDDRVRGPGVWEAVNKQCLIVAWRMPGRAEQRKPAGPAADDLRKVVMAALIDAAEGAEAGKRETMNKLIGLTLKVRPGDSLKGACGLIREIVWPVAGSPRAAGDSAGDAGGVAASEGGQAQGLPGGLAGGAGRPEDVRVTQGPLRGKGQAAEGG